MDGTLAKWASGGFHLGSFLYKLETLKVSPLFNIMNALFKLYHDSTGREYMSFNYHVF